MRKSREVLEYRWKEMTVIANDVYETENEADVNSAGTDSVSAELSDSDE